MTSDCKITKDTRISDAIRMCPESALVFERLGMGCYSCMAASAETIEEGALMHDVDVDEILKELNASC